MFQKSKPTQEKPRIHYHMKTEWLEQVVAPVIEVDGKGIIIGANNYALRFLGYRGDEIEGMHLQSLCRKDISHARYFENFIEIPPLDNLGLMSKTGRECPVLGISINKNIDAEDTAAIFLGGCLPDSVEEPWETQTQLRHFQIMTLGRMTEGFVNEFSNIIGVVAGYTEMAREGLPDNDEIKKDLTEVLSACSRGKKLLNNINALCKKNAAINLHLDAERSIAAIIRMIQTSFQQRISIEYYAVIEKILISADPVKLEQLMFGILLALGDAESNANKNKKIKVSICKISQNEKLQKTILQNLEFIQILIESSQISLSEVFIKQFNMQDSLPGSNRTMVEGMVSTARKLLEEMNGRIELVSHGKDNLAISILFPVVEKSALEKPLYSGPARGTGQCVLVIDDELQVADLTAKRLEKMGYKVVQQTNSREALSYFKKNHEKFSLVITDQVMPDLLGLDLAKEILSIEPNIPIIMMTGYSSGVTEKKCRECGINHIAMKPIDERELATIVDRALHQKSNPVQERC